MIINDTYVLIMTVTRGTLLCVFVVRSEVTNIVEGVGESTLKSIHKFISPLSLCSYKHNWLD